MMTLETLFQSPRRASSLQFAISKRLSSGPFSPWVGKKMKRSANLQTDDDDDSEEDKLNQRNEVFDWQGLKRGIKDFDRDGLIRGNSENFDWDRLKRGNTEVFDWDRLKIGNTEAFDWDKLKRGNSEAFDWDRLKIGSTSL